MANLISSTLAKLSSFRTLPTPTQRDRVEIHSFPKSGRTWLTVLVGEYIKRRYRLDVEDIIETQLYTGDLDGLPTIRFSHDDKPFWKRPEELDTDKSIYRDARVGLIVRDPRDIIVSAFFEKTKRLPSQPSDRPPFCGSIKDFVYHEVGGIDTIIAFFNLWIRNRDVPQQFLIIRYEDLHAEMAQTLETVLRFAGIEEIDPEIFDQVLELGQFDAMQQSEKENTYKTYKFFPGDISDPESYKVRRGKIGGYVDYLDAPEIEFLNQKIARQLDPAFGYAI